MKRRSQALVISAVLVAGLTVSGTYLVNAAPAQTTKAVACVVTKTGKIRVITPSQNCANNERRLSWNKQGPPGNDGADGLDGTDGLDGADGADGADGHDGTDGADGLDGAIGRDGVDGVDGAVGPAGPAGPPGPSGAVDSGGGGIPVLDLNPYDLTYRMQLGSGDLVEVTGFTQQFSSAEELNQGPARVVVGDLVVTTPMTPEVVALMSNLTRTDTLDRARFEMCLPTDVTRQCFLDVQLTDALVAAVEVEQSLAGEVATLRFRGKTVRLSYKPGTNHAATTVYDRSSTGVSSTGSAVPSSSGDTFYTAAFRTAGRDQGVISTESWKHSASNIGDPTFPDTTTEGKAELAEVQAQLRAGQATIVLFRNLVTGATFDRVEFAGCRETTCTQSTVFSGVSVSAFEVGSPTLLAATNLDYRGITWVRTQGTPRTTTRSFAYDLATGMTSTTGVQD